MRPRVLPIVLAVALLGWGLRASSRAAGPAPAETTPSAAPAAEGPAAAPADTTPALGAALRSLPWWKETPVQVRRLDSFDASAEALRESLPSDRDSLDWYILGPIPARSQADYYRSYPPEEAVDLSAPVLIDEVSYTWRRPYPEGKTGSGLDLRQLLKADRGGVAYLYREFTVEEPTETRFFIGFYTGCRLWLNGEEIFFSDSTGYNGPDRIELPVRLRAGVNRLLVKTFSRSRTWAFHFHRGEVNPRRAYVKGYWLLADLFPDEPEKQRWARLRALGGLMELREEASLKAVCALAEELAAVLPATEDFLNTLRWMAYAARDWGHYPEAERLWSLLLEVARRAPPEVSSVYGPEALAGMGYCRGRRGDIRGAERAYRRLLREYPKAEQTAEALWNLAEYHRREGRTWLARPYYEQFLNRFGQAEGDIARWVKAARPALDWCRKFPGDRPRRMGGFTVARLLAQAARREQAGETEAAVRLYLRALRQWPQELVRVEENRLVSVADLVRDRTRTLWPRLDPQVQAALASEADQALRPLLSQRGYDSLAAALRRHPLASSAPEALLRWAGMLLERGELARAAAVLSMLLDRYRLPAGMEARSAAELAFCARRLGAGGLLAEARRHLAGLPAKTPLRWEGREATVGEVLQWLESEAPPAAPPAAPPLDALPPEPVVVRLLPDLTGLRFFSPRWPTPRPPVPWRPAAEDGVIYCADLEFVRALTPAGRLLWRSRPYPQPVRAARGRDFKGLPTFFTVTDGPRLYALQLAADSTLQATHTSLFAYDRATGQVLWSTEAEPSLLDYDIVSPPLVAFDRLYVLACDRQVLTDQRLLCLEPETGRLLSSTLTASANGKLKVFSSPHSTREYDTLSLLPPPAADERSIYVVTQMGSVSAVDGLSGEVQWVLEYPRTSLVSGDDAFMVNYILRGLSPPVLWGELLIVAPRDNGGVFAVDRRSGELRWRRDDYEFCELWGVGEVEGPGGVVVAGEVSGGVVALAAGTGEVRWHWRPPAGERAGRGLIAGARLLVPTGRALYELSLADGSLRGRLLIPGDRRQVTGLLWTPGGLAASWEEGLLLWPTAAEGPTRLLDETWVKGPGPAREPAQPESAEEPAPEEGAASWAPVSAVAGPGAHVALLRDGGTEEVISWDGRWLSLYRLGSRVELAWRRALAAEVEQVGADAHLVVAAAGPRLVALERETGRELWRWEIPVRSEGYWTFDGTSRTFSALVVGDGLVLAGLYRSLWALDARTGTERWHFTFEYDLRGVSLQGDWVFAVSTHHRGYMRLYRLAVGDGRPRTEVRFQGLDVRNLLLILAGGRLWAAERGRSRLTAYDLTTGTQQWQKTYPGFNRCRYVGRQGGMLLFVVQQPRGRPPQLLAVEEASGVQAFRVESPEFTSTLKGPQPARVLTTWPGSLPVLVVRGEELGLESGVLLLFQRGGDLLALPARQDEPAARWPLFAPQEVLTGIVRQGPYLWLAVSRPVVPATAEAQRPAPERPAPKSVLFRPTVRLVKMPEGELLSAVDLPPVSPGLPLGMVATVRGGLLHLGPAGLTLLAPAAPAQALERLLAQRSSPYLQRSERVLLETLIGGLAPVNLQVRPCGEGLSVRVDGDLSEWSGVPAVRFGAGRGAWRERFPEVRGGEEPRDDPLEGTLRLAWDKDWLYLAVEVSDAVHRPGGRAGLPWRSDVLSLRLVPRCWGHGWHYSFRVWVSGEGVVGRVREFQGIRRGSARAAVGRRGHLTTYEVALPRGSLSPSGPWPPPPGDLRLALTLSDRDDSGLRELLTFPAGPFASHNLETFASVAFLEAGPTSKP